MQISSPTKTAQQPTPVPSAPRAMMRPIATPRTRLSKRTNAQDTGPSASASLPSTLPNIEDAAPTPTAAVVRYYFSSNSFCLITQLTETASHLSRVPMSVTLLPRSRVLHQRHNRRRKQRPLRFKTSQPRVGAGKRRHLYFQKH